MAKAIVVYNDGDGEEGHDATVTVPVKHSVEDSIFIEARRHHDGETVILMLSPQAALEIASALIGAVDGCGILELGQEALNSAS